jgi:hypothetical protein
MRVLLLITAVALLALLWAFVAIMHHVRRARQASSAAATQPEDLAKP